MKMLGYISTRSYSLYLLHPEALALAKRFFAETHFVIYYGIALAVSLLITEVLYRLVEVPLITMRSKYSFSSKRD
jgi:peptidoglycan/LPS O-acetylase OafA/YrhL